MNKDGLIRELRRRFSNQTLAEIVPGVFAIITDELRSGREVRINNFGIFKTKTRHARRMPKLRATVKTEVCPDMRVVKFRPSEALKKTLK